MKQHFTKRLLALLLTLAMVLSLVPMTFAEETAADEYVLATELKDGDQVVIYNPGSKTAVSSTVKSNYYLTPVETTVEDDAITDPDASVVWTVAVNEDGSYTFTQGEFTLAAYASGTHVNLSNTAEEHDPNWIVTAINSTEKTYNLKSATVEKDSKPVYLEYYSRYTEFSAYATDDATGDAFAMQFYVLNTAEEPIDPPEPGAKDVIVLYTNDIHCGVDQTDSSIGIAGLAKVKKELKNQYNNVVLVDNGDAIQGELIGTVSKGEYMVQLMNYVGFDFAAFGNHEYDYTMPQLKKLVDMANVKYLSCNFRYIGETPDENAVDLDAYTVVDYDGLKVGYVGITTPESLVKSTPTYFQDENGNWIYTFCNGGNGQELYDAVQTAVDAARADGAQVVVALAHLGIDEQSSPWMSTDVIANTTGIDVMLDGHSHSTIERQEVANKNGETVLLSSTGTKLANVGKLTITPDGTVNTELIQRSDVDGVDPETQAYLEQIEAEFEEMKQQVVAHVDYDLLTTHPETGKRMIRMRETNLGDVCADAYRTVLESDIAFVNGGGIRANIPAGDVTYEQIISVHPYSNMACKVKATGQQILDALEMSARNLTMNADGELEGENGGFLHVSGLKFTINLAIPSSVVVDESKMFVEVAGKRRVQDVKVLQNGEYVPIDPEGTYTLASHNYMLKNSGDGINMFKDDELLLDEVKVDNQVLIEYMTSEAFAAHDYSNWEGEGRIRIVNFKGDELAGKTVILHTNDTHGALLGFAQVAQVKADLEAQGARVILVDAGDFSQGTTYVSTNKGAAAITVMKAAGYDFITLGNHEFDFGYANLMANLDQAEGQIVALCADVFEGEDTILPAYAVKEVDGVKIGFFGMETPETQTKVNPGLITEIEFGTNENGKFLSSAQNAIAELKDAGADVIIGLVHLGVDAESEPYRSTDLYAELKDDVDFIIDGHSHTVMTEGPNGEPIQSTGTKASATALMNVGCIVIDNDTKAIVDHYLIPLGKEAPVDETVAAVAREIMDAVDAEYGAKFAESEVDLNGDKAPGNRNMETNLGDLITDALKWSVLKDLDAETLGVPEENVVAITNGGGIRAWIHKGDITKNDVNTVLPFGNTVAVVYVTGAELLEALEASTYCTPTAVGGFPQVSGIKFTIDTKKSFDKGELYPGSTYHGPASIRRVTINEINGQEFDPEATYAVVTNNFCAAGGDTYYAFQAASSQFDTGIPMDEALMAYIVEELNAVVGQDYAEPQGRITIKNGFDDVQDPSKYYYTPVYWAYDFEPQITGGKTDSLFGIKDPCTREQIVTFLWKAYGAEEPTNTDNPFTDVKEGKYYFKAVMWAKENNITSGKTDTKFGVKEACTREQVVTFLWKAAGKPEPTITESPFTDVKEGKYYTKAVLWALENGVTGGVSADKFGVGKTCTREQIVSFLYKAIEGIEHTCFPSTSNEDIAKYGNIYTDMDGAALFEQGYNWGDIVTVKFLDKSLDLPLVPTFSYVDSGTPGVFVNKDENGKPTGRVFMAINMGNFAEAYGLATKTTNADKTYFWTANEGVEFPVKVTIRMNKAGGYLTEMTIRDINRTNNREDYPELSDEEFANFRRITTTGMGDHLYRGSSPINPEIGRNTYADAALEKAGVTVVMNLANSQADAEAYPGFAETYYSKQNVVYLNLGVDFFAEEFKTGLAAGLRHFAENQGVYYVHCTEGKDRAGFVSALLECFMGATYEEVVADYLKTYTNYYTVVDGKQQALSEETLNAIAESNIIKTLQRAFDVEDLTTADLAAEAEAYIKELGLNDEEIAALKTNLGGGNQPSVKTSFPSATKADIDKYGDVHLSISSADLAAAGFAYKDLVKLSFLDQELIVPIIPQYRYVGAKAVGLVMWEDGTKPAEVEVFNGSFAASYGLADVVREGSDYTVTPREGVEFPVPVTIELYEKQGYADTYAIFDLTRSNNREDYRGSTEPYPNLTDEEFANFRKISTTGMGEGTLYRSSSPINPSIGRNGYADAAAEAAGIKSFVNLADSAASAAKYAGYAETYYSNQNIAFLNLGVDFTTELNREGVVSAMDFIAAEDSEAPFLVHCNEGQDRAGFVSGLLECLMGASAEEVIEDYMITFYNYYGVQKGSDQYAQISNNIVKNLSTAFGIETADFASADLAQEAADYLKELGVSEETIAAVKEKLGGAAGSEAEFEFLITSDIHGQFFATDYTRPYEQSGTHNQGMTRISTYLKEQKAEYGDNAYIVDMGDTFQGAPLTYYYAFNKPEVEDPAIKTFRHIGYDMWIVGNHEFNYGLDILTRQMDYAVSPSTENEKQLTISMANYLKAETNNDETKDWATWRDVAPYVIKDFDGVKVAIIGFGNPNIPQWDVPANWEGIYFANILDTYKHYEPEMLEQADMIVAVAHSGIGSDPDSDFMERLINATDSIAFAFSGHEHGSQVYNATNAKGETVPILQPGTKARYVAKVLVNYDKAEGSYEIAPELVDLRNYPLDEELVEILQPYETDTWENYMLQPIGKALGDFPAANLGTAPSAFVDLINTVQLWGAYDRGGVNTPDDPSDDTPAMLSITAPLTSGNNANLISQGDIYLGDMFGLYRFENWFYQITMSGEEVHQWLEYSASKLVSDGNGGYNIQGGLTYYDIIYGEGFHYDFDASKPAGERVVNMKYNGQPVTPDQEFTVVVNNYRYNGGGDYVKYLNEHGCSFTPNDPDRIIYSTQFDMIQGEDEGQARTLLTRYIQQETEAHGGITPTILSDWRILDGSEEPTEPSFVKVTGSTDLTDGVYLIVYEADGYAMDGSLENMDVVKDYAAVSIQDGAIPCTEELLASAFTIDMSAGTIANASGVYIGRSSDANGLEQSASPLTNSISIDAEGNAVIQSGGAYLRFNSASDQLRFRYFKSSTYTRQKDIALYKLVEG